MRRSFLMERCILDFKNITKKKWLPYVCLVILFLCVIVRFFTGPVVGFGNNSNFILSNDFWNFAKSILQGKVLYKDLIDHKGLYLYVPYMILYLVSDGWFGIVQIAEAIAYILTLLAFWKMYCLLLEENTKENKKSCKGVVKIIIAVVLTAVITYFATINIRRHI